MRTLSRSRWKASDVAADALAFSCLLVASLAGAVTGARAAEPTREAQLRFYESKVRPLLIAQCGKCHGAEKQEGQLRLDTPEGLARGGMSGPVVVAGQPERSLLISAVGYKDEALQMPPDGKLPTTQIADLVEWVKQGAAFPGSDNTAAPKPLKAVDTKQIELGRGFWAFQPPMTPPLPEVRRRDWARGPVDLLILAPLEARGISPVAGAGRTDLLRRVTFDLTGLPPRTDEVEAFLADQGPDAYARVIDRLMASPRHGETWARHWLDIARYSDSNGLDENIAHGNAFRYRDYVVAALNHDKPYDQFLREQLAGDLLPSDDPVTRNERLIATGFLALGPKVLAEVDERKMEMDIVDEQIDTFGKSILGLTLGCCRCHDHKFDPLPMSDYYALAGIFKSTKTMEHFKKVARWHENSIATSDELARKAEHERKVAEQKAVIDKFVADANAKATEKAKEMAEETAEKKTKETGKETADAKETKKTPSDQKSLEALYPAETKAELKKLRDALTALEKSAPAVSTAMGATEGKVEDVAIHVRGSHQSLGAVVPRRFPLVMTRAEPASLDANRSGRLELAEWLVAPEHPLTGRVMANRLWRWHFGHGIVRSTDNFGALGDRPTNQPLLDWLARRLIAGQWSLKSMHREILLSSTYQLSSATDAACAAVDPENRLQWRADVRRLEAEAVRDALLAASQSLDFTAGGSLLHVKNREYLFDHTSKDGTKYDSPRRSVYLPVIRNNLYDVFQLFDYADASVINGNRDSTTVAPQALFMLNSDVVNRSSAELARQLVADESLNDAQRIRELYLRAFGREPTDADQSRAAGYLAQLQELAAKATSSAASNAPSPNTPSPPNTPTNNSPAPNSAASSTAASPPAAAADPRRQAWTWLCQAVLGANEFIYLR